jgi:hypothetical protein
MLRYPKQHRKTSGLLRIFYGVELIKVAAPARRSFLSLDEVERRALTRRNASIIVVRAGFEVPHAFD